MIDVYLDKNVLSHILTVRRTNAPINGVTFDDIAKLGAAVKQRKIRNLISLKLIEEAAYALNASSPKVAEEELAGIREFLYLDEIIKFPMDLIIDNVISFVNGRGLTYPLRANRFNMDAIFSYAGDLPERRKSLADTTTKRNNFYTETVSVNDEIRGEVLTKFGGVQPSFAEYYKETISIRLEHLIQRVADTTGQADLPAICAEKGFTNMLAVPTLAVAAGTTVSYEYARVFTEVTQKRSKRLGDYADVTHALSATAANILVTHDSDFQQWFERVPGKGVLIFDHLHQLLKLVS